MSNFNAFTGKHLEMLETPTAGNEAKRKKTSSDKKKSFGKQKRDSDEELFARGESIEITETMRRDINMIQQLGSGGAAGLKRYEQEVEVRQSVTAPAEG